MHELIDLIELVKSDRIHPEKIFTPDSNDGTKTYELFSGILTGKFKNDEEAADKIYGCDAKDKRFLMLKKNLFDDLALSLSAYDYSKFLSEQANDLCETTKAQFAMWVLIFKGKRATGTFLAKKLLKKAEELHYTQIRIDILKALRESASLAGDHKSFEMYCEQLRNTIKLFDAEMDSEEVLQRIEINLINSVTADISIAEYAENYLKKNPLPKETSFALELNHFRIKNLIFSIRNDSAKLLANSLEVLDWLKKYPKLASKARETEFLSVATTASIMLQKFDQAREFSTRCLYYTTPGIYNWFIRLLRLIQVNICLKNISAAMENFHLGVTNPEFQRLSTVQRERWFIIGAYLSLFLEKIDPKLMKIGDRKIRKALEKSDFWSEMHVVLKDKEGMNLTVLILQLIFVLEHDEPEDAKSKLHLIQKYVKRSLKEKKYPRTEIFLQLIGQHIKTRSVKPSVIATLEKELQKGNLDDVEYVPYSMLWEMILLRKEKISANMRTQKFPFNQ